MSYYWMRVHPRILRTLECTHMTQVEGTECLTCKMILEVGVERHWHCLFHNKRYAEGFCKLLEREMRLIRWLPFLPWIDFGLSVCFFWCAYPAIILALAIANNEPGSRQYATSMLINVVGTAIAFIAQRHFRKRFT